MENVAITEDLSPLVQQINPAGKGWLSVNLGVFVNETNAPCDLFRRVKSHIGGRPKETHVLFAQQGYPFGHEIRTRLADFGIKELYVHDHDAVLYFNYVKEMTDNILRDEKSTSAQKATAVYTCCQEIMKKVYYEPRSTSLEMAKGLIEPTVETIIADPFTSHALIRMASFDSDTYTHCTNVGIFGIALAKAYFGLRSEKEIRRLGPGFFLHDIGKCQVPVEILNKPGPLSPRERKIVERHPVDGIRMLKQMGVNDEETLLIAAQHHERDDGKGYVSGLNRSEIHPYARICRLADIFEALTSNRPYHRRRSSFDALKFMQSELTTDIDAELFKTFVEIFAPNPRR
ncbi:MAG: HD domain-containing protein [Deltaproteobacteria bacterium]|nr:HD domain-containing protein [Deltaproteobacteria bacterium]